MIHCETPSGIINDINLVGDILKNYNILFYVDFVASAGSVAINVSANNIDIGLLGSQKVLSLPPDLAIVTFSEKAWKVAEEINYVG